MLLGRALPTELPRPSPFLCPKSTAKTFATAHFAPSAHTPKFRPPLNNTCGCPAVSNELALAANEFCSERAWWTGKDSNLRSPQGAADLQSAGFSHSPTRPSLGLPRFVQLVYLRGCEKTLNPETRRDANSCPKIVLLQHLHDESAETQNGLVSKDTSPFDFNFWNCSASLPCRTCGGAGGGN